MLVLKIYRQSRHDTGNHLVIDIAVEAVVRTRLPGIGITAIYTGITRSSILPCRFASIVIHCKHILGITNALDHIIHKPAVNNPYCIMLQALFAQLAYSRLNVGNNLLATFVILQAIGNTAQIITQLRIGIFGNLEGSASKIYGNCLFHIVRFFIFQYTLSSPPFPQAYSSSHQAQPAHPCRHR